MSLALLVPGAGGMLGRRLLAAVAGERDVFARGVTSRELDVTDPSSVRDVVDLWSRVVRKDSPRHRLVVVNAAAWTAVDAAEVHEEAAYAVNATGPALLAGACAEVGARLIHLSTDYVFDGTADRPYEVDDEPAPRSAYGRTKLAGELAVRTLLPQASQVVRTAWLYDTEAGFVGTMRRLEAERETVDVVDDQRGSPTWSADLARALLALAAAEAAPGAYHCTNAGATTWFGLARAVFEELGADPERVRPTTSAAYAAPAPRPASSVLSSRAWQSAGLPVLRPWREALTAALTGRGPAGPAR